MIDDLSKRLLELEFKSNYSTKSKFLKWIVKKNTARLQRMKNTQLKTKTRKTGKEITTTYCLGYKDYTHNLKQTRSKNEK